MVIWGAVAFFVVSVFLDTPRLADTSIPPPADEPIGQVMEVPEVSVETEPSQHALPAAQPEKDEPEPLDSSASRIESSSLPSGWYVQIGTYSSTVEAEVERLKYNRVSVPVHTDSSDDQLTHLLAGPHNAKSDAARTIDQIKDKFGLSRTAIWWIEGTDESEQTSAGPSQSEISSLGSTETADGDQSAAEAKSPAVADSTESSQPSSESATAAQPETAVASSQGNWYIQVGAFKDSGNARTLGDLLRSKQLPLKIENSDSNLIRVLVGPYPTRNSAIQAQSTVQKTLALDESIIRRIDG